MTKGSQEESYRCTKTARWILQKCSKIVLSQKCLAVTAHVLQILSSRDSWGPGLLLLSPYGTGPVWCRDVLEKPWEDLGGTLFMQSTCDVADVSDL